MNERTKEEVAAEIAALEACKGYVPRFTVFRQDNHRHIDHIIEFLRGEVDTTADEFWDDFDDRDRSAIMDAEEWLNGKANNAPSSDWDHFKK